MNTDSEGIAEFLTVFPGYYITRSTHIHLTAQTNVSSSAAADTSYSTVGTKHVFQLFFNETFINQAYELYPYNAHLSTLNRTLNEGDSVYITANTGGCSAEISVNLLGDTIADGIVGYITVGINSTAANMITTGGSISPIGVIPTVSVESGFRAAATGVDIAAGYGN